MTNTDMVVHEADAGAFSMQEYLARTVNAAQLEAQRQLATAYDAAVNALVGPNDIQHTAQKDFKKKSAWRKLARYFHISTSIVSEHTEIDDQGHIVSSVVVRGTAPWGQYTEALGKCSTREPRFTSASGRQKADHDVPATAQTRATNRAISDLIAAGEVSAEEVDAGGRDDEQESPGASSVACPKCGGPTWDNRIGKTNPRAPDFKCRDKGCNGAVWPEKTKAAPREPREPAEPTAAQAGGRTPPAGAVADALAPNSELPLADRRRQHTD